MSFRDRLGEVAPLPPDIAALSCEKTGVNFIGAFGPVS